MLLNIFFQPLITLLPPQKPIYIQEDIELIICIMLKLQKSAKRAQTHKNFGEKPLKV